VNGRIRKTSFSYLLFYQVAYTARDKAANVHLKGESHMAERQNETVIEWLDIKLDNLSSADRVGLITEVMDTLSAQDLRVIRDEADKKRQAKLKDARAAAISEMREKFSQLELSFEEVLADESNKQTKRRSGGSARVKYRGPEGEEWSGRGRAPVWLKNLEAEEHNREEYLVQPEK
jgi:DNA-binding protein H-NS